MKKLFTIGCLVLLQNSALIAVAETGNEQFAQGAFKFEDRAPIYYSNGEGHYCWYESMDSYVALTGKSSGWRTQNGKLLDYNARYDGVCTGAESKPASHPDPDFHGIKLAKGAFKFEDRAPIYYSNGEGHYCWYESMDSYIALTGKSSGWRTQKGRLSSYIDKYDGICTGTKSKATPHPDPDF